MSVWSVRSWASSMMITLKTHRWESGNMFYVDGWTSWHTSFRKHTFTGAVSSHFPADLQQRIIVKRRRVVPVAGQIGLGEELSEQHAVCHVLEHRSFWSAVLKTNTVANLRETTKLRASPMSSRKTNHGLYEPTGIGYNNLLAKAVNKTIVYQVWMAIICQRCAAQMAHLIPKLDAHFLCHSGCHGHGSHSARLRTTNLFSFPRVALMQKQVKQQVSIYAANI